VGLIPGIMLPPEPIVVEYLVPGTYNYTVPPRMKYIRFHLVSGGGGGGSGDGAIGGGGGGSGNAVRAGIRVVPGQVLQIAVGAGGIASTHTALAGVGGDSSIRYLDRPIAVNLPGGARGLTVGGAGGSTIRVTLESIMFFGLIGASIATAQNGFSTTTNVGGRGNVIVGVSTILSEGGNPLQPGIISPIANSGTGGGGGGSNAVGAAGREGFARLEVYHEFN